MKATVLTILFFTISSWAVAQLDSSILEGMPKTYFDFSSGKKVEKPWRKDFFMKGIEHKHSTPELSFCEIYFIDTNLVPHVNEEIRIYSVDRKKSKTYFTDSIGKIEVMLPKGVWNVSAKRLGQTKSLRSFAKEWTKPKKLNDTRIVYLYNWEETIALNILFEPGRSAILERSYHQLDELYEYLHRHSDIRIEIIGHTDNTGSPEANLKLSKARSETVKQYLVQKGINASRLTTDGKGDTQPIAENTTEKGKAQNRRTEIRVLP